MLTVANEGQAIPNSLAVEFDTYQNPGIDPRQQPCGDSKLRQHWPT